MTWLPDFRLFNFGIGVHLLQAEDPESLPPKKAEINPKDNHISFTTVPTQPPPPLPPIVIQSASSCM